MLDLVKRDPNVDGIIAIFVSPIMIDAYEVARAIADAADGRKPVLSVFMGRQRSKEGVEELRAAACSGLSLPRGGRLGDGGHGALPRLRDAPPGKEVRFKVDRAGRPRGDRRRAQGGTHRT